MSKSRLAFAVIIALFSIISYLSKSSTNTFTNETQHIGITPKQEVALGIQAAPQMAQQHGGLHPDRAAQARVDQVGNRLLEATSAANSQYPFEFHLLADTKTVNAFALPGGQVFITAALYQALKTEGQLAGVLGHEIGHVLARHGAQHIAKQELTQGLTGAFVVATYDPSNPNSRGKAQLAMLIGNLVNMRYGREDELQSDSIGVRLLSEARYDPRGMIEVMHVLERAAGSGRSVEFFSTHPNPGNRIARIEAEIKARFPNGVPAGLIQ